MTRYYSCKEIGQKLASDAATLHTNLQDVPPRHRSLRAIVEHSCQLLTATQCRVLEACTVFAEAFTVQAGSFVANAQPQILFSLADASLLKPTDAGRFEMHPLVQQYALAKLRADPTVALEVRRRHAEYFANWVESDIHELLRSPIKFHLVHRELANLRSAWHFAAEHKHYPLLPKLADGLFLHFLFAGPISEGISMCEVGLKAYGDADYEKLSHAELQFQSILFAGKTFYLMFNSNEHEFNLALAQSFPLAEKAGSLRALTLLYLAICRRDFLQDDFAASERHHRLALEAARSGNLPYMVGIHLAHCSAGIAMQGRIAEAIATAQEGLHILQQHGYVMLYGYALANLSLIYLMAGDLRLAGETIAQALQANQAANATLNVGNSFLLANAYAEIAHSLVEEKQMHEAQTTGEKVLDLLLNHPFKAQYKAIDAAFQLQTRLSAANEPRSTFPLPQASDYAIVQSEKSDKELLRRSLLEKVTTPRQLLDLAREKEMIET